MRSTYIVTYHIADPKRLRRVFKTCKAWGEHLQFSVFECELTPTERQELHNQLADIISPKADQVLFIALGPRESRPANLITSLGIPYSPFDAPCYIV